MEENETSGPTQKRRKNLLIFVSNEAHGELYHRWTLEYQQHTEGSCEIGWNWDSETLGGFIEVTWRSIPFDILVVDQRVLLAHREVSQYIEQNPQMVVGILENALTIPTEISVVNSINLGNPCDIDDWLAIIHRLLDAHKNP